VEDPNNVYAIRCLLYRTLHNAIQLSSDRTAQEAEPFSQVATVSKNVFPGGLTVDGPKLLDVARLGREVFISTLSIETFSCVGYRTGRRNS
jgi:hypothetical protein